MNESLARHKNHRARSFTKREFFFDIFSMNDFGHDMNKETIFLQFVVFSEKNIKVARKWVKKIYGFNYFMGRERKHLLAGS